jgi:NADH-quinone oxidoreductase subunit D
MEEKIKTFEPEEEIVLNMGPQHPSTHGVLRIILKLSGEKIVEAKPDIGYLHRGVEKLGETVTYVQFLPMLDRNDYLSATTNEFGLVLAVEKLANIPVPERAQYIRVLFSELSRLASHLVWLGTFCLDLGGALGGGTSVFLFCFREREKILDIFEKMTGARLHPHLMQYGGVRYDVYPGMDKDVKEILDLLEERITEYEEMLENNPVFIDRTKGVGILPKEVAMEYGCSGPVLRGSGVKYDLRKAHPYSSYDKFDFEIPVGKNGDVFDRFKVRMEEMRQSIRIVRQALEGLPEGPISSQMPVKVKVAVKAPQGEVYAAIESPRGELGYYIYSDGKPTAYRLKIRAPSFSNLSVLPYLLKDHLVADVVAILGSLDPVFGDVDR